MSELVEHHYFVGFLDEILDIDKGIRFAAVYDGKFKAKYNTKIIGYFSEEEIRLSLLEAQDNWNYRKKRTFKVGEPKFAMAQYGKINRITLPINNGGVMLVTTELGINVENLVNKLIEIRQRYFPN